MAKSTPQPDLVYAARQRFDAAQRSQAIRIDEVERRLSALTATSRNGAIVVDTADKGCAR
jgi:hypothetical protein